MEPLEHDLPQGLGQPWSVVSNVNHGRLGFAVPNLSHPDADRALSMNQRIVQKVPDHVPQVVRAAMNRYGGRRFDIHCPVRLFSEWQDHRRRLPNNAG
jgi:hypothetical protein